MRSDKPGIRIILNDSDEILTEYEDQFKPYEKIFGSKILSDKLKRYKGTLMRLPFRKSPSEICKTKYSVDNAKHILNILFKYSQNLLLFTQNLCKFSIFTLSDESDPENMAKIFEIEKSAVDFISFISRFYQSSSH
jgi:sacsin